MKKNLFMLAILSVALLLSSCYGTKTYIGAYREIVKVEKDETYTYSKGKQAYLFWGFLPLGRTQVATPPNGTCQIKTRHGFLDMLLTAVTGGLFSMQTIKVKVPKSSRSNYSDIMPALDQENGSEYQIDMAEQPPLSPELF